MSDDDELIIGLLLKSLKILETVKEEHNKAEWNMCMAYEYQYLEDKEESVIAYVLPRGELYPADENALLVVEECREEIKNRVKKQVLSRVYEIVEEILKGYKITDSHDYFNRDDKDIR